MVSVRKMTELRFHVKDALTEATSSEFRSARGDVNWLTNPALTAECRLARSRAAVDNDLRNGDLYEQMEDGYLDTHPDTPFDEVSAHAVDEWLSRVFSDDAAWRLSKTGDHGRLRWSLWDCTVMDMALLLATDTETGEVRVRVCHRF